VRLVYLDGGQHPAFSHRIAEVSRPDALTPPVELALDDPNARYNAKARSASTAAALVLAQAQLRAQPSQAQAIAPEPGAPGEKFAAAALGAFHHDDAKPEIAPLATEGAKSVGVANDASTASIAPPKAVEPKQSSVAKSSAEKTTVAKSNVAKSNVAKTSVTKTSATKTGAEKPQAAKQGKQKIAEAATLR
jgi:hypothetical protein